MKIWFPLIVAKSGSDVYVNRLTQSLNRLGIETVVSRFPHYFEFAPHLLSLVKPPADTDIIHTNSWNGFAFHRDKIPLIATLHHPVMAKSYLPYKSIGQTLYHNLLINSYEQKSFSLCDKIIAVSDFSKNSIKYCCENNRIAVIHNYVDTNTFCPSRELENNGKDKFRLLYVGNTTARKGFDLLAPIMDQLGDAFLLTATTGIRGKKVRIKSKHNNMRIVGGLQVDELVREYQKSDALLFPSLFEGFGYAPLEAMACGKPVITSDNSALPEVVEHNKTGILCETNNVTDFALACRFLRDNPDKSARYGRNGRKRAVTVFSETRSINQYLDLYREVTARKSSSQ